MFTEEGFFHSCEKTFFGTRPLAHSSQDFPKKHKTFLFSTGTVVGQHIAQDHMVPFVPREVFLGRFQLLTGSLGRGAANETVSVERAVGPGVRHLWGGGRRRLIQIRVRDWWNSLVESVGIVALICATIPTDSTRLRRRFLLLLRSSPLRRHSDSRTVKEEKRPLAQAAPFVPGDVFFGVFQLLTNKNIYIVPGDGFFGVFQLLTNKFSPRSPPPKLLASREVSGQE